MLRQLRLVDMMAHAIDNPAPWTYVLISGDRDFAYAISVLGLRGYRVVLFSPSTAHISLKSQATTCLDWDDVLKKLKSGSSRKPGQDSECPPTSQSVPYNSSTEGPLRSRSPFRGRNSCCSDNGDFDLDNGDVDIINYLKARRSRRRLSMSSNGSQSMVSEFCQDTTTHTAYFSAREEPVFCPPPASVAKTGYNTGSSSSSSAHASQQTGRTASIPVDPSWANPPRLPSETPNSLPTTTPIIKPNTGHSPKLHPSSPSNPAGPTQLPTITSSLSKSPVPEVFQPLVRLLREYQARGFGRPSKTALAEKLDQTRIYSQAKVDKFGQYIALAERCRIVTQSGDWITLRPEWS